METQAQKDMVTNLANLIAAESGIISDLVEFKAALDDSTVNNIFLTNDITFDSDVVVDRAVKINGNDKSFILTGTAHRLLVQAPGFELLNATVTGSSEFNVIVQDTTVAANNNAKFKNVIFSESAKGGLLVLNSTATIENVTTTGNNWGGIELSEKATGNPVGKASVLTVVGTHTHDNTGAIVDTTGVAVWSDDETTITSSITGNFNQYIRTEIDAKKVHYTKN